MSRIRVVSVLCALACAAVPGTSAAKPGEPHERLLEAVNEERRSNGLGALKASPSLNRSARRYSDYMMRRDYFGHLGSIQASSHFDRLGEAVAIHTGWRPMVWRTVRDWLRSAPHRALLLGAGFRYMGAGISRGSFDGRPTTVWTIQLGSR
jgi:uncharacterized protein YkwD